MTDHSITSLIEKLEGAEVGSRDLDMAVARVLGFGQGFATPHLTTSLDAALALAECTIKVRGPIDISIMGSAQVVILAADPCANALSEAFGNTPALALCAAVLRAQSEARV